MNTSAAVKNRTGLAPCGHRSGPAQTGLVPAQVIAGNRPERRCAQQCPGPAWPKAERIIAATIGQPPEVIWPSRYAKRHSKPVLPPLVSAMVLAAPASALS
jgi:hypothetical protein